MAPLAAPRVPTFRRRLAISPWVLLLALDLIGHRQGRKKPARSFTYGREFAELLNFWASRTGIPLLRCSCCTKELSLAAPDHRQRTLRRADHRPAFSRIKSITSVSPRPCLRLAT